MVVNLFRINNLQKTTSGGCHLFLTNFGRLPPIFEQTSGGCHLFDGVRSGDHARSSGGCHLFDG